MAGVYPGSAAARAGVKEGDVILAVDGHPVNSETELNYRVATQKIGDQAVLDLRRGTALRKLNARVEAPIGAERDERVLNGRNPLSGATVVTISPAVALEYGGDPFQVRGVLVTKVEGLSTRVGLRPGDVVRAINGRDVATAGELQGALGQASGVWRITVNRNGREITATLRL